MADSISPFYFPTRKQTMYKILLADDHQLFREGVELILAEMSDCEITGSVSDGQKVVEHIQRNGPPDLLLMDLQMPGLDGKATMEVLHKDFPSLRVIIISMYNNPAVVRSLIAGGANGYVLKNADKAEFKSAIRKVLEGGRYFSAEITEALAFKSTSDAPVLAEVCSERELEIVKLVAEGMSNQQIADKLFLSVRTVETHRKNIMSKLELSNVAGLVRLAFQQGLIS